jgi:hypothetical protein
VPRFLALILLAASALQAADSVVRAGSFEVYSLAGDREAKEIMNFAEQLRYTIGWQLGNADIKTTWPVRILLVKKKQPVSPECRLARDAYVCSVSEPAPAFATSLTRIVLDSWNGYLPPPLYRGLIQVYSTVDIEGPRITLGTVPAQKDRDWGRAHMLAVDPNYSGKLRVLLGNLSKGVETEVAWRNAFGESPEGIESSVDRYLTAGNYGTIRAQSRPLAAQRQLIAKDADPTDIRTLQADLLFANGQRDAARKAYAALNTPAGHEGLGLLALQAGNKEEAARELAQAASARSLAEYAKLLTNPEQKRAALTKATAANDRWADPQLLLAEIETHPAQKLAALRKATTIQPGRPEIWVQLAELQEANKQLADAAKSWAAAERATGDPEARERVRAKRLAGEQARMEADRRAKGEERRKEQAEAEAFRNSALLKIREAEARANAGRPQVDASKLERYKEDGDSKKIDGTLTRVNCLGRKAELVVTKGRQVTTLLVSDPSKIAIAGGGERTLACGPLKPARSVTVEYTPRTDLGKAIAGEAVSLEFH